MFKEYLYKRKRQVVNLYRKYFTINHPETYILSDKSFIKKIYKHRIGRKINLRNPKTFTEKENWLKLYDRKDEYTMMVDKFAVRDYISEKIGEEYLVPLLGVWDSPKDIDFSKLPNEFVLKCNHNSDVIICRDKVALDIKKTKEVLQRQLEDDYYLRKREWPYKNVKRKIICEQFMENTDGTELVDYKVWCFNGEPKFIMLNSGRFSEDGLKVDMYDLNWRHMDMTDGMSPQAGDRFKRPSCLEKMIELSKKLSKGIPFIRVDFNYWNNKLYFGELTFFDAAGLDYFRPVEWDYTLGEWLVLPKRRGKGY